MSVGRSARRVLIVCAATAACASLAVGPAAAASTGSTASTDGAVSTDNGGLLGLGTLVSGLTSTLLPNATASPGTATQQSAGTGSSAKSSGSHNITASAAPASLGSVLEGLPVLGPVLTPVVQDLPILGGTAKSAPPASSTPVTSTPASGTSSGGTSARVTTPASAAGSTWTNRNSAPSTDPVAPSSPGGGSGILDPGPIIQKIVNALPSTAAGKAEV